MESLQSLDSVPFLRLDKQEKKNYLKRYVQACTSIPYSDFAQYSKDRDFDLATLNVDNIQEDGEINGVYGLVMSFISDIKDTRTHLKDLHRELEDLVCLSQAEASKSAASANTGHIGSEDRKHLDDVDVSSGKLLRPEEILDLERIGDRCLTSLDSLDVQRRERLVAISSKYQYLLAKLLFFGVMM